MITYEHAEDLTRAPAVDLRHHGKWDTYPLPQINRAELDPTPVDDLEVEYDPKRTAELDALMNEAFGAEQCPVPRCARTAHPLWEMHEDADGNGWFPGWAPR